MYVCFRIPKLNGDKQIVTVGVAVMGTWLCLKLLSFDIYWRTISKLRNTHRLINPMSTTAKKTLNNIFQFYVCQSLCTVSWTILRFDKIVSC